MVPEKAGVLCRRNKSYYNHGNIEKRLGAGAKKMLAK